MSPHEYRTASSTTTPSTLERSTTWIRSKIRYASSRRMVAVPRSNVDTAGTSRVLELSHPQPIPAPERPYW